MLCLPQTDPLLAERAEDIVLPNPWPCPKAGYSQWMASHQLGAVPLVEARNLSPQQFAEQFMAPNQPVLIRVRRGVMALSLYMSEQAHQCDNGMIQC
jgi:hypothetical protein